MKVSSQFGSPLLYNAIHTCALIFLPFSIPLSKYMHMDTTSGATNVASGMCGSPFQACCLGYLPHLPPNSKPLITNPIFLSDGYTLD